MKSLIQVKRNQIKIRNQFFFKGLHYVIVNKEEQEIALALEEDHKIECDNMALGYEADEFTE